MRDCWDEKPEKRPDTTALRTLLKSMHSGRLYRFNCDISLWKIILLNIFLHSLMFRQKNLMDHVMNTLENHADNLEKEVEERMKELVEEKKKSNLLLYRMLPK